MAKMNKKTRNKIAAVSVFVLALGYFMWPGFNGQTGWERTKAMWSGASTAKKAGAPTPRYKRPPTSPYQYADPAGGAPTHGRDKRAAPVHDVTARDQAQLDALIRRKSRNR
jgi:hypothetical protein